MRAGAESLGLRADVAPVDWPRAAAARVRAWRGRVWSALGAGELARGGAPEETGRATLAPRNESRLICRVQPVPLEPALTVFPLYEPIPYRQALQTLMAELLATADSDCLSYDLYDLDSGLGSLMVLRNLATRMLETAIRMGELRLLN
jgi:hypothetical protein